MKSLEFPDQDEKDDIREARELWLTARTLADARELTASWIEGILAFNPGAIGGIEDETVPIAGELAEINRRGLWTQESQPGEATDSGSQREFVHGLCSEAVAERLCLLSNRADLVTISFPPGNTISHGHIPVSAAPGAIATVHLGESRGLGDGDEDNEFIRMLREHTTPELAREVASLWEIQIFDPVWGRTGLLFPSIIRALTD